MAVLGRWLFALWVVSVALATGCSRPYGRFQYVALHSRAEGRTLRYGVYVPTGWDRKEPIPLVVLLHGAGDDAASADRRKLVEGLDHAIRSGELPLFLLVTPDGERGFWTNWYDGSHRYRDWVMEEVIPGLRARFPLLPEPEGMHLVGVSMGGGGGLQLWLHERERFASLTVLSAPILDERDTRAFLRSFLPARALDRIYGPLGKSSGIDPYALLRRAEELRGSKLLFGAASADRAGILASNRRFHEWLGARSVPHRFVVFPGRHGWSAWAEVLPYALCLQLTTRCRVQPPSSFELHE